MKARRRKPGAAPGVALALAIFLSFAAEASIPVPDEALARGGYDDDEPRVEARLLVHPDDLDARGPVRIGVLFDMDPGWHIYWRNPGETGLPTTVRWSADGAEMGPTSWPAPSVFGESGGLFTSYGYADQVLLTTVATWGEVTSFPRVVRADAELLVCEVECIPAKLSLERRLDPEEEPSAAERDLTRESFETYAARVPVAPEALDVEVEAMLSQSAIRPNDRFKVALAVRSCARADDRDCDALEPAQESVAFFPDPLDSIELEPQGIERNPAAENDFLLVFDAEAGADDPGTDEHLSGVLALRGRDGALHHVEVDLPLPRARAGDEVLSYGEDWLAARPRSDLPGLGFLQAVALAFLGGLILNLMPCVLPVLAMKVFALAELAHRDRRDVLANAAAYTGGILLTMSALAAVVVLLQAAGTSVGWGFQFQEPLFVGAISVVLVVFALNLFGVFEIRFQGGKLARMGEDATGAKRSFFEGLLAVVLATPCTAPFLGAAVGFAFAGPGAVVLAIFLAIGLGLATPFALVSLVPAWARWIPRSGAWMLKLRAGLGFALLASVVWLLWIVGRSLGADGVINLIALLLAVAFVTWLYGMAQGGAGRVLRLATALGLALIAWPGFIVVRGPDVVPESARGDEGHAAWRPFERTAVSEELAAGRRVFVYFTADWCLTCKMNEGRVIRDERVQAELERMDVAVFRGDWTRRDDTIRTELARFGRAGVPLYLVYHPSAPDDPVLLPELLTSEILLGALHPTPDREDTVPVHSS